MSELGSFWYRYQSLLSKDVKAEMIMYRFTFATFLLKAETRKAAEGFLRHTWQEIYNDCDAITEIMILECSEKDTKDIEEQKNDGTFGMLRSIYNGYYGVTEYQRLITELTCSLPLLRERSSIDVIRAQNYLFAIDSGYGFTTLISSLGDYLHRMDVYEEEGKGVRDNYYEVVIGEETENGFYSQDDLTETLYEVEKDKNPYNIIGLDVSYFLEGKKYDELRRFLKRLERYQNQFVFAFRVPFLEKRAMDELIDLFSDLMLVRCIQVPPFADPVLMEVAWNILTGKGFEFDTSLLDLILEKIHREKMDGRFYGFRTIDKIACEIIMHKAFDYGTRLADGETPDPEKLKAEDVSCVLGIKKEQKTGYAVLE